MFSMILISHLNFTTKRERIPYILAFFESCLLEYLKSQVDVDKSTETQADIPFDSANLYVGFISSEYVADFVIIVVNKRFYTDGCCL